MISVGCSVSNVLFYIIRKGSTTKKCPCLYFCKLQGMHCISDFSGDSHFRIVVWCVYLNAEIMYFWTIYGARVTFSVAG